MLLDVDLISRMKKTAKDIVDALNPRGDFSPESCLWQNVEFDHELFTLILTYDVHDKISIWHLTISKSNETAPTKDHLDKIVEMILGKDYAMLPEDYFPVEVRYMKQFIKKV
jgi:hypothetical protein